jgi:hypothetical protein
MWVTPEAFARYKASMTRSSRRLYREQKAEFERLRAAQNSPSIPWIIWAFAIWGAASPFAAAVILYFTR